MSVPVHISIWVMENKFDRQFSLFLFLKIISNGILKYDKITLKEWNKVFKYSHIKTLKNHLDQLSNFGWISIDKNKNLLFVRSYNNVSNKIKCYGRKVATCKIEHIYNIEAYLGGVLFTKFYSIAKWKNSARDPKNGGSIQRAGGPLGFQEISSLGIAACTKINKIKVHRYKTLAIEANYIEKHKNIKILGLIKNSAQWRGVPIGYGKKLYHKGFIRHIKPDFILSNMFFKKRKNMKRY